MFSCVNVGLRSRSGGCGGRVVRAAAATTREDAWLLQDLRDDQDDEDRQHLQRTVGEGGTQVVGVLAVVAFHRQRHVPGGIDDYGRHVLAEALHERQQAPAITPLAIRGKVIVRRVRNGPAPRFWAASSTEGSIWASEAAALRNTSGTKRMKEASGRSHSEPTNT